MKKQFPLAFVVALVTACGGSPEAPPPAAPTPPRASAPTTTSNDDAARRAREAEAAAARARAEAEATRRTTLAEVVYFDYDRSEVRADSRAVLDRKARVLREVPTVRIRIEGHADERGSTEYNLALGSRRAETVRSYLTGVGISQARMDIITYGEGRPAAQGQGEATWSRNRRAEFAVLSGSLVTDQQ